MIFNGVRTLIIAEAGVNHNGSEKLALELVNIAADAGADIVKFQTFKAKNIVTRRAWQANYQIENSQKKESQLDMLSRLELSEDTYRKLVWNCNEKGIEFLSTAFDVECLEFLVNDLGVKRLKIPSGEITNAPLVLAHARTGRDIILSTGMASLSEIESALGVIAYGYAFESENPGIENFNRAYYSEAGQRALKEKVSILHCTTEYPAPMVDINLKAMDSMAAAFRLPVGYSDHSEGIAIPIAAVARGAQVIEKHFTLDKTMEGPDHKASLEPEELASMVREIRNIELALGDGVKGPRPSEVLNKMVARKSLVASKSIVAGEQFSSENVDVKRPGDGRTPYEYWTLLDTVAARDYNEGDLIDG